MERKPLHSLALAWALVLAGTTPSAAQEDDLDRCAELESDAARLACFDAVLEERRGETPTRAAPAQPAEPAATAEPGPATPQEATQAETARASRPAESSEPKQEYTAVVTAMRTRPHGQVAVTLDNGEVWSEQYASRGFLVEVGDTVTMKKARFSSAYRLVAPGGRAYTMIRLEQ